MLLNCGAKVTLECEGLKKGRACKALLAKSALRRLFCTRSAWWVRKDKNGSDTSKRLDKAAKDVKGHEGPTF